LGRHRIISPAHIHFAPHVPTGVSQLGASARATGATARSTWSSGTSRAAGSSRAAGHTARATAAHGTSAAQLATGAFFTGHVDGLGRLETGAFQSPAGGAFDAATDFHALFGNLVIQAGQGLLLLGQGSAPAAHTAGAATDA
jgi:hypothetical protein